jgi:hypothetical protein
MEDLFHVATTGGIVGEFATTSAANFPPDLGVHVIYAGATEIYAAACPPCPGDLNGDGLVNFTDFTFFSGAYSTQLGDTPYNPCADLNADGLVNFTDFTAFSGHYGVPCP